MGEGFLGRIWGKRATARSRAIAISQLTGLVASLAILAGGFAVIRSGGDEATAAVCNDTVPLGALPPAVPEWCKTPLAPGTDTHVEGPNSWLDDFNSGQSHAALSPAYVEGKVGDALDIIHFQHNNHWMADIQGNNGQWPTLGAAWARPNRTFSPDNGKVVVEYEVAGPIAGTRNVNGLGDSWPEVVLSTASSPSHLRQNGTYLYESFPGAWTFGCRMQQSRHPICALYEPADGYAGGPTRQWEINQTGGQVASQWGGDPSYAEIANTWLSCSTEDPDTACRNKFRMELTPTELDLFVNGTLYYQAYLMDDQLANVLNAPGGFYVYFGDFAYQIDQDVVVRFHWDRLAVNPTSTGGGTPPPPTQTTVVPTSTPTQPATTPTTTPTPTPTLTPPTPTTDLPPCRVAVQQWERNKWRTIRYENVSSEYCMQ